MRKFLSLSKTLLKCSMGMLTDGKSKKGINFFLYFILALSAIVLMVFVYLLVGPSLEVTAQIGQSGSVVGAIMFLCTMLILVFSIFLIPSIFYFSSDSNTLLSLPIKPEQIIGAKFAVCTVYEYSFSLVILLPTFIAYVEFAQPGIVFYLSAILAILLIPIFPLVISTIITILVMRFVPFFKNRDRFNMVAGILSLVFALSLSFFANSSGSSLATESAMIGLLSQGDNSLIALFTKFFPTISFFVDAMSNESILSLLLAVGVSALSIIVLLTLGKFLYFKGAIGFGETSTSNKKLSEKDMRKANQKRSKTWTYAMKEMKILFRTPVFFINCILMCFLMPILLCIMPFLSTGVDIASISQFIPMMEQLDNIYGYLIFIGLGIGFLFGTINSISATSISREGSQVSYMKYIPMSYAEQIHAKSLCGIIAGIFTMLFTLIPIAIFFPMNPLYFLILFVSSVTTVIIGNELAIIFDVMHPKLVWEQESAAVKQNMGATIMIFAGLIICGLLIALCFMIPTNIFMISAIITLIVSGLACILSWIGAGKFAEKMMKKI